jgi:hypothetical protein
MLIMRAIQIYLRWPLASPVKIFELWDENLLKNRGKYRDPWVSITAIALFKVRMTKIINVGDNI